MLMPQGVVLEPAIGSARFARLVVELLLVSQVLYTLIAAGLAEAYPALFLGGYYSTCAVGFSGVLFALKVGSVGWSLAAEPLTCWTQQVPPSADPQHLPVQLHHKPIS